MSKTRQNKVEISLPELVRTKMLEKIGEREISISEYIKEMIILDLVEEKRLTIEELIQLALTGSGFGRGRPSRFKKESD